VQIELEYIIVNALLQLNNYKNLRSVAGEEIKNGILALNDMLNIEGKQFKVFDCRNCMKNSKFFDVCYTDDFQAECVLKENVTIRDLIIFNFSLPYDVVNMFKREEFLNSLGIIDYDDISINDILIDNINDFYFQVGKSMDIKEYIELKSLLKNKKCLNCMKISCSNRRCNLTCEDWDNIELLGKSKVLRYYGI